LAGRRGLRGKWTAQQKRRIVADSRMVGASIQEVADKHGVRPSLLSKWRREAGKSTAVVKAKFAAVSLSAAMPTREGSIEIDFNGGCVRVRGVVDAGMLREVMAAAR
jgi:transposase-like protein